MKIGIYASSETLLDLSDEERRRHIYLSGQTGTGKSTLLQNMMLADFRAGRPFALLDPHGDLSGAVADSTPRSVTNDVLYLDPQDPTHVVGFNPLARVPLDQRSVLTARIVATFHHVWSESWGPRLEYILGHAIRLLLDNKSTLLALPLLLVDDRYREALLKRSSDPLTTIFWVREYAGYSERLRAEAIAPLQNKAGQLVGNSTLRAVLGQTSTLNIPYMMDHRKYLIANLSKSMGEAPSHMLGAFLATVFAQAAEARAALPEAQRQDFTLYVDEFQNFTSAAFAAILSEARKWRLNLVVANQFMTQLPDSLRAAVLGNVGTIVVFRVGADDAEPLARQLGHGNPTALSDTPNYQAWVRSSPAGTPSSPRLVRTLPPQPSAGRLPAVLARTRARHARPRPLVARQVAAFLTRF